MPDDALAAYHAAIPQMQQGGVAAFAGGTSIAKAGVGAIVTKLIDVFAKSNLSHVGLVPPSSYWQSSDPWMIESTEWQGVSGPQFNALEPRLQIDYADEGGQAWFYPIKPECLPLWDKIWAQAQEMFAAMKAGKLHYSVVQLLEDANYRNAILDTLPGSGAVDGAAEQDSGMVCSGCVASLLEAGGLPELLPPGTWLPNSRPPGSALCCTPEDVRDLPAYIDSVQIL